MRCKSLKLLHPWWAPLRPWSCLQRLSGWQSAVKSWCLSLLLCRKRSRYKFSLRRTAICQKSEREMGNTSYCTFTGRWCISGTRSDVKKMAQAISPCSPHEAQRAQGRGSVGPVGLHGTYVNTETCKAREDTACRVPSHRQCVWSSLRGHVPATQMNVQERDTVDTFPLCSLFKASGQRISLLHTCSCPFIYSTLINVKNQFGSADTIPATVH